MINDKQKELALDLFEQLKARFPEIHLAGLTESAETPENLWVNIVMPSDEDSEIKLRGIVSEISTDVLLDYGYHITIISAELQVNCGINEAQGRGGDKCLPKTSGAIYVSRLARQVLGSRRNRIMAAIPASDLPGHQRIHRRVVAALDRCQESQDTDFKESQKWEILRPHIVRSTMAMSNLRDGGVIIIGVSERGSSWSLTGISRDHLETFSPDVIIDHINRYASPPVKVDIVTVEHNGSTFLAIYAHEFTETPTVCQRPSADNGRLFASGQFLVRPPGKPQTKPVEHATEMHDLLELAAEKRARKILEISRRIGLRAEDNTQTLFDEELNGL